MAGRLWKFKIGTGGSWLELINTEVHSLEDSVEAEVQEDALNLSLTKRSKFSTENPKIGSPKVTILGLEVQVPNRDAEPNLFGVRTGSEKEPGPSNKLETMKSVDMEQSQSRRMSEHLDRDGGDK